MEAVSAVGLAFQELKDPFEFPGVDPVLKIPMTGGIRDAIVMRQVAPAAARGEHIKDTVYDRFGIRFRPTRPLRPHRQIGSEKRKLLHG